jgi:hypothetical protein
MQLLLEGQMDQSPDKPNGSKIEELASPTGVTLRWPLPSAGWGRYVAAAFLGFWLCLWATALVDVLTDFAVGVEPELTFLAWFWLGGWTLGGIVALWFLWQLVRPEEPESVQLDAERLRYLPGRSMCPHGGSDDRPGQAAPTLAAPSAPAEVSRSAIRAIVVDRRGVRQQLWLDLGTKRREIGASLTEADREWLYAALRTWHSRSQRQRTDPQDQESRAEPGTPPDPF